MAQSEIELAKGTLLYYCACNCHINSLSEPHKTKAVSAFDDIIMSK